MLDNNIQDYDFKEITCRISCEIAVSAMKNRKLSPALLETLTLVSSF